jgi:hypothetical protein
MLFPSVRAPTVHDALFCVFPIVFLLSFLSIHRTIMSNLMQSTGEMANTIDDGQDASQLVFLGSCGMQLTSIIRTPTPTASISPCLFASQATMTLL